METVSKIVVTVGRGFGPYRTSTRFRFFVRAMHSKKSRERLRIRVTLLITKAMPAHRFRGAQTVGRGFEPLREFPP